MSFKLIITCIIVLWLLNKIYKVVFPILHITSTANTRMRQMQEQMKEMENRMDEQSRRGKRRVKTDGDYIDYEELK